ncbi:MAG: DUF2071 domain-containing protein [Actinomycetota bacterium]|nr:DUF2071 domain-containing protein [Actinomycetota bacterium]
MRAPALKATIQRRLLVNYRINPDVLSPMVPAPFRPQLVGGFGMAGICLIRLSGIRPSALPAAVGLTAENAAHRIAVEWDTPDGIARGVYIPRRDTSSRLIAVLGGRVFPGWHHLADFDVQEGNGQYQIYVNSRDGEVSVEVSARLADEPMAGSVFASLEEASWFFRRAPVGYSVRPILGAFDGVELGTCGWGMQALLLEESCSSFFDDPARFAPGSAVVDSAFLMEGLDTRWTPKPRLVARAMP